MSRTLPTLAVLLLLARCLAPAPASAADPPPADGPRPLAKLAGPSGNELAWSPDGKYLLSAGADATRVWEVETSKPIGPPILHRDMQALKVSWAGGVVLTVGSSNQLWNVWTGKSLGDPHRQAELAVDQYAAALSGDGSLVALGTTAKADDGTFPIDVWDVKRRRSVHSLRHKFLPDFAVFSPDGKRLLNGEAKQRARYFGVEVFHLWDVTTGDEVSEPVSTDYAGMTVYGQPAAFSPDGRRIVLLDHDNLVVLNGATGTEVARKDHGPSGTFAPQMESVCFNADGSRILTHGAARVEVWDASTLKQIGPTLRGWDAALNPAGTMVAAVFANDPTDLEPRGNETQAAICDVATGRTLHVLSRRRADLTAWSPDGHRIAVTLTSDGYTCVWEVPEGKRP